MDAFAGTETARVVAAGTAVEGDGGEETFVRTSGRWRRRGRSAHKGN